MLDSLSHDDLLARARYHCAARHRAAPRSQDPESCKAPVSLHSYAFQYASCLSSSRACYSARSRPSNHHYCIMIAVPLHARSAFPASPFRDTPLKSRDTEGYEGAEGRESDTRRVPPARPGSFPSSGSASQRFGELGFVVPAGGCASGRTACRRIAPLRLLTCRVAAGVPRRRKALNRVLR